jgi:hypothetical protein
VIRGDARVFVCYRECILYSLYISIPVHADLKFINVYLNLVIYDFIVVFAKKSSPSRLIYDPNIIREHPVHALLIFTANGKRRLMNTILLKARLHRSCLSFLFYSERVGHR